jgi:hypothetical protein
MDGLDAVIRPATAGDTKALAMLCGVLGYPTAPGDAARRFAELAADHGHDFYPAAGCRHVKSQHVHAIDLGTEARA